MKWDKGQVVTVTQDANGIIIGEQFKVVAITKRGLALRRVPPARLTVDKPQGRKNAQ